MDGTTELLLLLASILGGMSLGSLVHGLWRSRAAERAQSGAWGIASGLKRRVAKPPRVYRHRASIVFAVELSLALALVMLAWFPLGALPQVDTVFLLSAAFWFSLGALGALFPLILGLVFSLGTIVLWLVFALAQGTVNPSKGFTILPAPMVSDASRSVTVEALALYRLVSPPNWAVDRPQEGSIQNFCINVIKELPGLTVRIKK